MPLSQTLPLASATSSRRFIESIMVSMAFESGIDEPIWGSTMSSYEGCGNGIIVSSRYLLSFSVPARMPGAPAELGVVLRLRDRRESLCPPERFPVPFWADGCGGMIAAGSGSGEAAALGYILYPKYGKRRNPALRFIVLCYNGYWV